MLAFLIIFGCGAISGVIVAVGVLYLCDEQPDELEETERLLDELTAMRDAAERIETGANRLLETVRTGAGNGGSYEF